MGTGAFSRSGASAARRRRREGRRREAVRTARLVPALLAAWLAGCVAPGADIHLEPLFARFTAADGAVETEALFGLFQRRVGGERKRHHDDRPAASQTTLGPLWSRDRDPEDRLLSRQRWLVPFGYSLERPDERVSIFVPLFAWRNGPKPDGTHEKLLFTGFGWVWRSNDEKGADFGWFPFWGDMESLSIFDRVQWFLWPLWTRTESGGSVGRHVLFPVFAWIRGEGKEGWRLWPLAGHTWHDGSYDRWFALWPFLHYQRNRQATATPEERWMLFPLAGRARAGDYVATTVLWPFFGYARDLADGTWALDLPWPLVRFQRGPKGLRRSRVWPFFSHLEAGSLDAWSFLWPIVHLRHETYRDVERDSFYVVPLWQGFDERDRSSGELATWRKLVPLFQHETGGDWERGSFPCLDPFQRNEIVDRHLAWLWKLWEWEAEGERRHGRAWGGLARRERGAQESRTSFAGLWSRRVHASAAGRVREHSLLFGLLRWRVTEDEGFDMLGPAFPGPGWPAEWTAGEPGRPARAGASDSGH